MSHVQDHLQDLQAGVRLQQGSAGEVGGEVADPELRGSVQQVRLQEVQEGKGSGEHGRDRPEGSEGQRDRSEAGGSGGSGAGGRVRIHPGPGLQTGPQ